MKSNLEPAVIFATEVDLLLHQVKLALQTPEYVQGFLAGSYAIRNGAEVRGLSHHPLESCFLEIEVRRHEQYESSVIKVEEDLSKLREAHGQVLGENANLREQTKQMARKLEATRQAHKTLMDEHLKAMQELTTARRLLGGS